MNENVYLRARDMVALALANLARCKVRDDALLVAMFIIRLSPKDGVFAFPTTIFGSKRFVTRCGQTRSDGQLWTRSRLRSCIKALIKIGLLDSQNGDTLCYHDVEAKQLRGIETEVFKDTPNFFKIGAEYGSLFAPPSPSPSPLETSDSFGNSDVSPSSATISGLTSQNMTPLIVALPGGKTIIKGRPRSDIHRVQAEARATLRAQIPLPIRGKKPSGALAGMSLSAAALAPSRGGVFR